MLVLCLVLISGAIATACSHEDFMSYFTSHFIGSFLFVFSILFQLVLAGVTIILMDVD
jgi:hypothetical protein